MAAQRRRSARGDRTHDAALVPPHISGVIAKTGLAMATQDIRDIDRRSVEGTSGAGHGQRRAPVCPGGMTSRDNRSSGLRVAWILWAGTSA